MDTVQTKSVDLVKYQDYTLFTITIRLDLFSLYEAYHISCLYMLRVSSFNADMGIECLILSIFVIYYCKFAGAKDMNSTSVTSMNSSSTAIITEILAKSCVQGR